MCVEDSKKKEVLERKEKTQEMRMHARGKEKDHIDIDGSSGSRADSGGNRWRRAVSGRNRGGKESIKVIRSSHRCGNKHETLSGMEVARGCVDGGGVSSGDICLVVGSHWRKREIGEGE